jgi:hypothetical protein
MHSVKTGNSYFTDNGWVAFLVTIPAMALDELADNAIVDERNIRFHLLVPLNEKQYSVKLNNGYDALLEYFEEVGKDIVEFTA